MFALDGKPTNFSENDQARRNTISNLLAEWGLIKIVSAEQTSTLIVPLNQLKILSYKEKDEWTLIPKYNIGNKKVENEQSEESYNNEEAG